jgi:hypothetical protein
MVITAITITGITTRGIMAIVIMAFAAFTEGTIEDIMEAAITMGVDTTAEAITVKQEGRAFYGHNQEHPDLPGNLFDKRTRFISCQQ